MSGIISNYQRMIAIAGYDIAAAIANELDDTDREKLLAAISEQDPSIAKQIIERMFVFDHLADIDDRSMQHLITKLNLRELVTALRGTGSNLQEKFFTNMSKRQANELSQELKDLPPQPKSRIEQARKAILTLTKQLAQQGEIQLNNADDYIQ